MHRRILLRQLSAGIAAVVPGITVTAAHAATPSQAKRPAPGAWVVAVDGIVELVSGDTRRPMRKGAGVRELDTIETGPNAEALLRFADGAQVVLRASSLVEMASLMLSGAPEKRNKHVKIAKGGLRYLSGKLTRKSNVRFTTSTATIGIRGTDIEIVVTSEPKDDLAAGTVLKVNSGVAVLDATDGSSVDVQAGEWAQGTEPELTPKGGGKRRPAARALTPAAQEAAAKMIGKTGKLDALLKR